VLCNTYNVVVLPTILCRPIDEAVTCKALFDDAETALTLQSASFD